jgi:hypothetical protein
MLAPIARVVIVLAVVALAAPVAADAHVRTGLVAVDNRASVSPLPTPFRSALAVRVYPSDQALGVTLRPGHTAIVLGYTGEPFLRLGDSGVEVDGTSPTADAAGLARSGAAGWQRRSRGRTVIWHDARVRGLPATIERRRWSIPLVVDGRRVRLEGEVWRVGRPSPWPWLSLMVPFAAIAVFIIARRRSSVRQAAAAFGAVAAAGTVAVAAAFGLAASASVGTWIEGMNELALALAGVAVIMYGSAVARPIAGGALGLLALSVGLSKVPVFLHGVVLSAFPSTFARLLVGCTISEGAAASAVGLIVFFDLLEPAEELLPTHGG